MVDVHMTCRQLCGRCPHESTLSLTYLTIARRQHCIGGARILQDFALLSSLCPPWGRSFGRPPRLPSLLSSLFSLLSLLCSLLSRFCSLLRSQIAHVTVIFASGHRLRPKLLRPFAAKSLAPLQSHGIIQDPRPQFPRKLDAGMHELGAPALLAMSC